MRWPSFSYLAIVGAAVAGFMVAGDVAARYLIESRQTRHLEELGLIALRRAEDTASYGVQALSDITKASPSCDAATLQGVRLHVYRHSLVKDIRVVQHDASVLCSAFSETLEFDKGWVTRDDMLPVTGRAAMLFRVEQFFGTALGVMVDKSPESGVIAIVGVNGSLLDVMPEVLRDASTVTMRLTDGREIARSRGVGPIAAEATLLQVSTSAIYPLDVAIEVDRAALSRWEQEPYWPIVALGALLGLIFGGLAARSMLRPLTPLEELDRGIAADEIRPYFQPLFDLRTRRIVGAELLARWVKPDGTVIPPMRFIELAEETGRIGPLTWHLLRAGLAELGPTMQADRDFKLSVNVSPRHFVAPRFVDELSDAVRPSGIAPEQIALEITERESFADPAAAARVVAAVRALGFKVALDDVGIGHSGLSQIQLLRADVLKVDKFFVDSLCRDDSARIMVETMVRLAADMNMDVVAEGIEDEEQSRALAACGVATGQGYVMSPPLPGPTFIRFMADQAEPLRRAA